MVKVLCSICVIAGPGLAPVFYGRHRLQEEAMACFPMAGGNYWADGNLEQCLPSALRPFTFEPRIKAFLKVFDRRNFCSICSVVSL